MLSVEHAPTLTRELLTQKEDTTIEELYEKRRMLVNRLLRCEPSLVSNIHLCTKKVSL